MNSYEQGKNVQVNLTNLIERVYVALDAAPWLVNVVEVILEKFNIDAKVIYSESYKVKQIYTKIFYKGKIVMYKKTMLFFYICNVALWQKWGSIFR